MFLICRDEYLKWLISKCIYTVQLNQAIKTKGKSDPKLLISLF